MISIDSAQRVLDAQPFSRLLGARVTDITESTVQLRLPVRDDLRQQFGFVHGGVLSYLADNAITYAGALGIGPDLVTSGFDIEYLAPAKDGVALVADATLVRAGRSKAVARCDIGIVAADGTVRLVATAQGASMVRSRGSETAV